jgi:hypothetical protein
MTSSALCQVLADKGYKHSQNLCGPDRETCIATGLHRQRNPGVTPEPALSLT